MISCIELECSHNGFSEGTRFELFRLFFKGIVRNTLGYLFSISSFIWKISSLLRYVRTFDFSLSRSLGSRYFGGRLLFSLFEDDPNNIFMPSSLVYSRLLTSKVSHIMGLAGVLNGRGGMRFEVTEWSRESLETLERREVELCLLIARSLDRRFEIWLLDRYDLLSSSLAYVDFCVLIRI